MSTHKTLAAAMAEIWQGFTYVGVLNGMPAVKRSRDVSDPLMDEDATVEHHTLTCYRDSDGSERWRNPGLGSV